MNVPVIVALDESIAVAGGKDNVLTAAKDAAVVLLELCPEHDELAWRAVCLIHSLVLKAHQRRSGH